MDRLCPILMPVRDSSAPPQRLISRVALILFVFRTVKATDREIYTEPLVDTADRRSGCKVTWNL